MPRDLRTIREIARAVGLGGNWPPLYQFLRRRGHKPCGRRQLYAPNGRAAGSEHLWDYATVAALWEAAPRRKPRKGADTRPPKPPPEDARTAELAEFWRWHAELMREAAAL